VQQQPLLRAVGEPLGCLPLSLSHALHLPLQVPCPYPYHMPCTYPSMCPAPVPLLFRFGQVGSALSDLHPELWGRTQRTLQGLSTAEPTRCAQPGSLRPSCLHPEPALGLRWCLNTTGQCTLPGRTCLHALLPARKPDGTVHEAGARSVRCLTGPGVVWWGVVQEVLLWLGRPANRYGASTPRTPSRTLCGTRSRVARLDEPLSRTLWQALPVSRGDRGAKEKGDACVCCMALRTFLSSVRHLYSSSAVVCSNGVCRALAGSGSSAGCSRLCVTPTAQDRPALLVPKGVCPQVHAQLLFKLVRKAASASSAGRPGPAASTIACGYCSCLLLRHLPAASAPACCSGSCLLFSCLPAIEPSGYAWQVSDLYEIVPDILTQTGKVSVLTLLETNSEPPPPGEGGVPEGRAEGCAWPVEGRHWSGPSVTRELQGRRGAWQCPRVAGLMGVCASALSAGVGCPGEEPVAQCGRPQRGAAPVLWNE